MRRLGGTGGTIAYLVLARGGVGGVRDVCVRILRVVALEVLVRELEAGVHGGVAGVEEGGEELDVGLLTVVVVCEKAGKACISECGNGLGKFKHTRDTRLELERQWRQS